MTLLDEYQYISNRITESDKDLQKYEEDLKSKKNAIKLSLGKITTLINPIQLLRLASESLRLKQIKKGINCLKATTILNNMYEEDGDQYLDFYNGAFVFKPRRIKEYMEGHKIYDEEIDKKLRLEKK